MIEKKNNKYFLMVWVLQAVGQKGENLYALEFIFLLLNSLHGSLLSFWKNIFSISAFPLSVFSLSCYLSLQIMLHFYYKKPTMDYLCRCVTLLFGLWRHLQWARHLLLYTLSPCTQWQWHSCNKLLVDSKAKFEASVSKF